MKYNLSNIMKHAWHLIRTEALTRSAALKAAWAEAKTPKMIGALRASVVDHLQDLGASRWHKAGRDRLYLNTASYDLIGLDTTYYNSGSLRTATLRGAEISNSLAKKIACSFGSAYIDLTTGKLVCEKRDIFADLGDGYQHYMLRDMIAQGISSVENNF